MQQKFPPMRLWAAGAVLAAAALFTAAPAAAQYVRCPYGYYYAPAYGCIPNAPAYDEMYGGDPDYDVGPPAYDSFGLAFGFGGGRGRGGGGRGGGGNHFGGGGSHGGGGHGGGGGGGHGHH
jgi:hypothetical protein